MDYTKLKKQELIDLIEARDVRIKYLEEGAALSTDDALIQDIVKVRKTSGELDKLLKQYGK